MVEKSAEIRAFGPTDLDQIVALDKAQSGASRRGFFDKRCQATQRKADQFISLVAELDGAIRGFVTAYVLDGEFGEHAPIAVVDAISLDANYQGRGIGRALMAELEVIARQREVEELRTQVDWGQMELLSFFNQQGFSLTARQVLERSATDPRF